MRSIAAPPVGLAAAREGLAAVRARVWLIALLGVLGLVAGLLLRSSGGEPKSQLWLSAEALSGNTAVVDLGVSTPSGPQASDFLNDAIVNRVVRKTGLSYEYLLDHLMVTQPFNGSPNPPIGLIAGARTQARAKALLLTWLASVQEVRHRYVQSVLARGERKLRDHLQRASRHGERATTKAIADLLARLLALRGTLIVDYTIVHQPRPVTETATPRPRAVAAGAIGGLIAGFALALALALLDGRLRTREGIEVALGFETVADLSEKDRLPSAEHAKERLHALAGGRASSPVLIVPCGSVDADDAASRLSGVLGEGIEVRATGPLGREGLLTELAESSAWLVAATPGGVRRREVAALHAELAGIGADPAGLLVV